MKKLFAVLAALFLLVLMACSSGSDDGGDTTKPKTYRITGQITSNSTGLAGVTVSLSGESTAETTTDSSGNYSFTGQSNGDYTVTPSLSGYVFSPSDPVITISHRDEAGIDFTATASRTVTFDSQNATVPASPTSIEVIEIAHGWSRVLTLPTPPTRTGYAFAGWWTGKDGTGYQVVVGVQVYGDPTVYAYWASYSYTVTFDSQYADVPANPTSIKVVSPAATVGTLPTEPTRTGFRFAGWWTGMGGTGKELTADTIITANFTVYAYWIPQG